MIRIFFTESNLANWFLSYVQFCSGGHFKKRQQPGTEIWISVFGISNIHTDKVPQGSKVLFNPTSVITSGSQSDQHSNTIRYLSIIRPPPVFPSPS